MQDSVDFLVNLIIRPTRAEYEESDLIGGTSKRFTVRGVPARRRDFELPSASGDAIVFSLYHLDGDGDPNANEDGDHVAGKHCVVYLHGNCGCRVDANEVVRLLLPEDICVCSLDFPGSGHSGGGFITLGAREPRDLAVVTTFLRTLGIVHLGLWGRSMGSVTALGCVDPSMAGMVVDSPFTNLRDLICDIARKQNVPRVVTKLALRFINNIIKKRAGFDIDEVDSVKSAGMRWVPALFVHGADDALIPLRHCELIFSNYAGDRALIVLDGLDHNDARPGEFYEAARVFFKAIFSARGGVKTPEELFAAVPNANANANANACRLFLGSAFI